MTRIKTGRASGVLVLVLALVNGAAVWGQAGWALENIVPAGWSARSALGLSLAFAAAIELIGVFLAMMADQGEDVGLPSGGVRLGSYAVGLVSGSLNFSHWYSAGVSAAIAFGFLSAVSPFLWGIWSRVRRGRLSPPSRRFWHPVRSVSLIRSMAWDGLSDENAAVRALTVKTPNLPLAELDASFADKLRTEVASLDSELDSADVSVTRPDSELDAWLSGYGDALSTAGQKLSTEVQAYVDTVSTPLPRRTRTPAGSVPPEFADMVSAWDPSALRRADMVRLSAAYLGVTERTIRRYLSALGVQPVSGA
jgi:hypothetical protein